MQKLSFLFLALFSFCHPSFSQVGIKAGINFATLNEDNSNVSKEDLENKSIYTPVVGLTLDLAISSAFSIQPEIQYAQSGGRNHFSLADLSSETVYKINYLELPVLAKIFLGDKEEGGNIHLGGGGWIGYALNGKSKNTLTGLLGSTIVTENKMTFDSTDNVDRINYGWIAEIGLGSIDKYSLDVRYCVGLNNLLKNSTDGIKSLQTRCISLTLGYKF